MLNETKTYIKDGNVYTMFDDGSAYYFDEERNEIDLVTTDKDFMDWFMLNFNDENLLAVYYMKSTGLTETEVIEQTLEMLSSRLGVDVWSNATCAKFVVDLTKCVYRRA